MTRTTATRTLSAHRIAAAAAAALLAGTAAAPAVAAPSQAPQTDTSVQAAAQATYTYMGAAPGPHGLPGETIEVPAPLDPETGQHAPAGTVFSADALPEYMTLHPDGTLTVQIPQDASADQVLTAIITVTLPDGTVQQLPLDVAVVAPGTFPPGDTAPAPAPAPTAPASPASQQVAPAPSATPVEQTTPAPADPAGQPLAHTGLGTPALLALGAGLVALGGAVLLLRHAGTTRR